MQPCRTEYNISDEHAFSWEKCQLLEYQVPKTLVTKKEFFECLRLYIDILQKRKNFILVEAIEFKTGIQYKFNLINLTYLPKSSKKGTISFTGNESIVNTIHKEYTSLSLSFWPNWWYRRFEAKREVHRYEIRGLIHRIEIEPAIMQVPVIFVD